MGSATGREKDIRTRMAGLVRELLDEGGVDALARLVADEIGLEDFTAYALVRTLTEENTDRLIRHADARLLTPIIDKRVPRIFRGWIHRKALEELDEALPEGLLNPILATILNVEATEVDLTKYLQP